MAFGNVGVWAIGALRNRIGFRNMLSYSYTEEALGTLLRTTQTSIILPLVSREWKTGSNSSYNRTPFLHSLLTKGKQFRSFFRFLIMVSIYNFLNRSVLGGQRNGLRFRMLYCPGPTKLGCSSVYGMSSGLPEAQKPLAPMLSVGGLGFRVSSKFVMFTNLDN